MVYTHKNTNTQLQITIKFNVNLIQFLCLPGLHKFRDGIFILFRLPGVDSKKSVPQACVAWQAGTATLFVLGSSPP